MTASCGSASKHTTHAKPVDVGASDSARDDDDADADVDDDADDDAADDDVVTSALGAAALILSMT